MLNSKKFKFNLNEKRQHLTKKEENKEALVIEGLGKPLSSKQRKIRISI